MIKKITILKGDDVAEIISTAMREFKTLVLGDPSTLQIVCDGYGTMLKALDTLAQDEKLKGMGKPSIEDFCLYERDKQTQNDSDGRPTDIYQFSVSRWYGDYRVGIITRYAGIAYKGHLFEPSNSKNGVFLFPFNLQIDDWGETPERTEIITNQMLDEFIAYYEKIGKPQNNWHY